jgi:arginine/lysine/ornithine decarboxylase
VLDQSASPLAEKLEQARDLQVVNFHSVPWAGSCPVSDVGLAEKYRSIFGAEFASADLSCSTTGLDSFFRPVAELLQAQRLAAEAFGADHTYFLSTGSTTANLIALGAIIPPNGHVLVDPLSHQSIHFGADGLSSRVQVIPALDGFGNADFLAAEEILRSAFRQGRPVDALVLTASTYDGFRLRCDTVLPRLARASPGTVILVDDAWAAVHWFSSMTRDVSPLFAAASLNRQGLNSPVVIVHSAHKTMRAMRQGAYLHIASGGHLLRSRMDESLFRHHTTSPSWPILASLDLARAHAVVDGDSLIRRSIALTELLAEDLGEDDDSFRVVVPDPPTTDYVVDPLKVYVQVPGRFDAIAVQRQLWHLHGIHIPRVSSGKLVLSFTIGIDEAAVRSLIAALRSTQRTSTIVVPYEPSRLGAHKNTTSAAEITSNAEDFVMAYPPGVPVSSPFAVGDVTGLRRAVELSNGAEFFRVSSRQVTNRPPNTNFG